MAAACKATGRSPMTDTAKISVRGLYKIFGRDPDGVVGLVRDGMGKQELLEAHDHVLALRDINLDIRTSEIFVVVGLSGSGKSTLIRHFNRIIEPTLGSIEIDGKNILALDEDELRSLRRKQISMVFQSFALMPHRTVLENVAYGLLIQGVPHEAARERAARWIRRVELSGSEDHYPSQLSGGMRQRVGLARALATDTDILLMDEPFSALDPLIRADMHDMLLALQAELNKTIVFITHDLDEALKLGDSIAILRDGEIIQQSDPQAIVLAPSNDYVGEFVKDINRGRVLKVGAIMGPPDGAGPSLTLADDTALEDALVALSHEKARKARVVDAAGDEVGRVELDAVVQAIAVPAEADT